MEASLQFPNYITDDTTISLVNGFLERKPELRLGASTQGAKDIKEHSCFAEFDWNTLAGRAIKVPWKPNLKKLQQNWEPCNGEAIEEGETDGKVEACMEWAKDL